MITKETLWGVVGVSKVMIMTRAPTITATTPPRTFILSFFVRCVLTSRIAMNEEKDWSPCYKDDTTSYT
jgi:hypothetical protein